MKAVICKICSVLTRKSALVSSNSNLDRPLVPEAKAATINAICILFLSSQVVNRGGKVDDSRAEDEGRKGRGRVVRRRRRRDLEVYRSFLGCSLLGLASLAFWSVPMEHDI